MTTDTAPLGNPEENQQELVAQLKLISSALGISKLATLAQIDQLSDEEMLGWFLIIKQSREQSPQARQQATEAGKRLLAQLQAESAPSAAEAPKAARPG